MTSPAERVYLIDASIYIFRYYFSLPAAWQTDNGRPTESVFGFSKWLIELLLGLKPSQIGVCFDESLNACFRNEIYPAYKSSRVLPDEDLAFQLLACKQVANEMGLQTFASNRYEADDLIGSLAEEYAAHPISIISRDKDLGQLIVKAGDNLWNYPFDAPLDQVAIRQKMGVAPTQIPDYLALVGDKIDDIPGVPGVGSKTAAALLAQYSDWETLKANLEEVAGLSLRGAKRTQSQLQAYTDQVDIALQLTRVYTRALAGEKAELSPQAIDFDRLHNLLEALGIAKALNRPLQKLKDQYEL